MCNEINKAAKRKACGGGFTPPFEAAWRGKEEHRAFLRGGMYTRKLLIINEY
jgi:hypothetical protein